MHKREKGFTLIELLVVIAIIGILSSVVLASLNAARGKGNNAKIKAQLAGSRASAAIYYDTMGSYGPNANCSQGITGMFADPASGMNQYSNIGNYPSSTFGSTVSCYSTTAAWAMSVPLSAAEGTSQHWCVDSTGASKGEPSAVGTTVCS